MIKKIVILILLLISVSAVSASDNLTEDIETSEISSTDDIAIEDSDTLSLKEDDTLSGGKTHTISASNYSSYFNLKGELVSTSINDGDTVYLDGEFSSVNFNIDKPLKIIGTSTNSMKNSIITLTGGASGSTVLNLVIKNTDNYAYGVFLNTASNCTVKNCFINNTGAASYCICLGNGANNNTISNNNLNTYGITYGHNTRSTPPIVISGSNYNTVSDNVFTCDDTNCIYFSNYPGGPLNGGDSDFNLICNNTISYNVLPTSWGYGIQVMGNNNTIKSNRVTGAYRGISTSTSSEVGGNVIVDNYIDSIRGRDFNNLNITSGGEYAIIGTYNSIIKNNTIVNSKIISNGAGISALDNSIVEANSVNILSGGVGIKASGNNVKILNNNISTESSSGIFQQGRYGGLYISGNNISSVNAVGISIKKSSSSKMPYNVTVKNNFILTSAEYIIDAGEVDANSSWYIDHKSNLEGLIKDPNGTYNSARPVYKFNGTVYNITPQNIDHFFENNILSGVADGDIIKFEGNFSDRLLKINSAVKITGVNAIFTNSTFWITSGGVWIENLTIKNRNGTGNGWGITVYQVENGVSIVNNSIEVFDSKAAYAIYVLESSYVDVINNTLFSSGDYLTNTLLVYSSSDCRIINNTIKTVGTSAVYSDETGYCLDGDAVCLDGSVCLDGVCFDGRHEVSEIHRTYGILMIYSSQNIISSNKVNVTSALNESYVNIGENKSTNTIIGIDAYYNSHNNTFSNNDVYLWGMDNYMYGMGVLGSITGHNAPIGEGATQNKFINNTIAIDAKYYASGIIIGFESNDTTVTENQISLKADNVSYGIVLELSQLNSVTYNNISLNSDIAYAIEGEISNNNIIVWNNITANSKKVYGIAISASDNNLIYFNSILANSTGDEYAGIELDSIRGSPSGIYIASNSTENEIKWNNITSTKAYAVNIGENAYNNSVSDNYLNSELGIGDDGVNSTLDNEVYYNYFYLVNATLPEANVCYLEEGELTLNTGADLDNATVVFYAGDYIGNATVKDAAASIKYNFSSIYCPGSYIISAVVYKKNYQVTGFTSLLTVEKGHLNITVNDVSAKDGLSALFSASITDICGMPASGYEVKFYRDSQIIGSALTDDYGIANLKTTVPKSLSGYYNITAKIEESELFNKVNASGILTILSLAPITVSVDNTISYNGIVATLTDNNGFAVANKQLSLTVGGVLKSVKTDACGHIYLPLNKVGKFQTTLSYNSDGIYENTTKTFILNVLAPITQNKDYKVYFGNTVTYKIKITDSNGDAAASGEPVTLIIGGKSYKVYTDSKGYVSKSFKLSVGKYTVTAKYNGYKVSNTLTFKSVLSAKNMVVKKSKKIKFKAKLVNKKGKALKGKKVTFKIKHKKYKVKTNKKGVAILKIKLKKGKYKITSSYSSCTIKNTIKVKK